MDLTRDITTFGDLTRDISTFMDLKRPLDFPPRTAAGLLDMVRECTSIPTPQCQELERQAAENARLRDQ